MIGHIYIYGEIENYKGSDANDYGVCSLKSVVNSFNNQKEATEFIVHIHSNGGDVHEGLAIYDFLKSCGKNITTRVDGMCASIASVILLAGSEREATENSNVFIHNAWTMAVGDANALEETSKALRNYTEIIKEIYLKETNLSIEELTPLMDKETSFNVKECIANGFINSEVNQLKAVAKINNKNMEFNLKAIKDALTGKSKEDIKNVMLTLADGVVIESNSEDAEPKEGDVLTLEDGAKVPDAVHELQSGYLVTTVDGVITVVEKIEEISETEEEVVDSVALENESLKSKVSELEVSMSKIEKENKEIKALAMESVKVINSLRNSVSPEINTEKKEIKESASIRSRVNK